MILRLRGFNTPRLTASFSSDLVSKESGGSCVVSREEFPVIVTGDVTSGFALWRKSDFISPIAYVHVPTPVVLALQEFFGFGVASSFHFVKLSVFPLVHCDRANEAQVDTESSAIPRDLVITCTRSRT